MTKYVLYCIGFIQKCSACDKVCTENYYTDAEIVHFSFPKHKNAHDIAESCGLSIEKYIFDKIQSP